MFFEFVEGDEGRGERARNIRLVFATPLLSKRQKPRKIPPTLWRFDEQQEFTLDRSTRVAQPHFGAVNGADPGGSTGSVEARTRIDPVAIGDGERRVFEFGRALGQGLGERCPFEKTERAARAQFVVIPL